MSTARDDRHRPVEGAQGRPRRLAAATLSAFMALNAGAAPAMAAQQRTATVVDTSLDVTCADVLRNLECLGDLPFLTERSCLHLEAKARAAGDVALEADAPAQDPLADAELVREIEAAPEAVPAAFGTVRAEVAVRAPEAQVAYACTCPDGTWSELEPHLGSTLIADVGRVVQHDGLLRGLLLTFAKPDDGVHLRALRASGAEATDHPTLEPSGAAGLPGVGSVLDQARRDGYAACCSWALSASRADLALTAQTVPVDLDAQVERVDGFALPEPGDPLRFRIQVGAQAADAPLELSDVQVTVRLGGRDVDAQAVAGTPGTFEARYAPTASEAARNAVDAQVHVEASYPASVQGNATARTTASFSSPVTLGRPDGVTYAYVFAGPGASVASPDQMAPAPLDAVSYAPGQPVPVAWPSRSHVALREGTWSFQGWRDASGSLVGQDVPMGREGLVLTGAWDFAPAPSYPVTYRFPDDVPAQLRALLPAAVDGLYAGDLVPAPELAPVPDVRPDAQGDLKQGRWVFEGWRDAATGLPQDGSAVVEGPCELVGSWDWQVPLRPATAAVTLQGHSGVFDGEPHGPELQGLQEGDQVLYRAAASTDALARAPFRSELPERALVGATYVEARVRNACFADDAVAACALQVRPRPVTIAVDDATWVAGRPGTVTGSVQTAPFGSDEPTGLLDRRHLGAVRFAPAGDVPTEPGVYPGALTASFSPNPNYAVTVRPGTLTIVAEGQC